MSDEQYGEEAQSQDLFDIDQLVSELDEVLLAKKHLKTATDQKVKLLLASEAIKMQTLADEEARLVREVATVYLRLRTAGVVKGKTLPVPSGTVSTRQSTTAEILHPERLMTYLRRHGLLQRGSKRQPRKLDKAMLGELMDDKPQVRKDFEQKGLMVRVVNNRLTVKPRRSQLEAHQELGPDDRATLLNPAQAR